MKRKHYESPVTEVEKMTVEFYFMAGSAEIEEKEDRKAEQDSYDYIENSEEDGWI